MINKSRLSNYLFISKQPMIYFYHIQIFYIYSLDFFWKELRNNNLIFLYNNFSCSPIATETLQETIKNVWKSKQRNSLFIKWTRVSFTCIDISLDISDYLIFCLVRKRHRNGDADNNDNNSNNNSYWSLPLFFVHFPGKAFYSAGKRIMLKVFVPYYKCVW